MPSTRQSARDSASRRANSRLLGKAFVTSSQANWTEHTSYTSEGSASAHLAVTEEEKLAFPVVDFSATFKTNLSIDLNLQGMKAIDDGASKQIGLLPQKTDTLDDPNFWTTWRPLEDELGVTFRTLGPVSLTSMSWIPGILDGTVKGWKETLDATSFAHPLVTVHVLRPTAANTSLLIPRSASDLIELAFGPFFPFPLGSISQYLQPFEDAYYAYEDAIINGIGDTWQAYWDGRWTDIRLGFIDVFGDVFEMEGLGLEFEDFGPAFGNEGSYAFGSVIGTGAGFVAQVGIGIYGGTLQCGTLAQRAFQFA